MIERKIKNAPVGQGTVRRLTREEWVEFREVRPRTPFESRLARPNARIRTEEPVRMVRHPVLFVTISLCSLADKRMSIRGMIVKMKETTLIWFIWISSLTSLLNCCILFLLMLGNNQLIMNIIVSMLSQ